MIRSTLNLMIFVVLCTAILGCGSLRKSAVIKPTQINQPVDKDTDPAFKQESADSVINLLSTLDRPLILANGIEISVRVLANMNVEDIQKFSVYTDADAVEAYGKRGTKGVIDIKSNLSKRELKRRVRADNERRK